jgi:multicomponent Na+:H+ antiporter subunit D
MSAAAKEAGYGWISWVFVFASAVTAAAMLRAAGHIFLGWGPLESQDDGPKHEEKPETREGHDRIPATMFLPAAALMIGGLLLGLVPALQLAIVGVAHQFVNNGAYTAHVLDGSPMPPLVRKSAVPPEWLMALLSIFAAIAIAGTHLASARAREISAKLAGPFQVLHRLHSGHIGDYVVFLTLGMASFGLICAYCVR